MTTHDMAISDYKLVTSNEDKLREFHRFGLPLDIEKGRDLPEVLGSPIDVMVHKAIAAGEGKVVEDTQLDVAGEDIGVNIRWLLDQLANFEGRTAVWVTMLAVNTGTYIKIYRGVTEGHLVNRNHPDAFGFDGFFVPKNYTETLFELDQKGEKDKTSARKDAAEELRNDTPYKIFRIEDVQPWEGEYQK